MMKVQIKKIKTQLEVVLEMAQEHADSKNKTKAARYDTISSHIADAIGALDEALEEW